MVCDSGVVLLWCGVLIVGMLLTLSGAAAEHAVHAVERSGTATHLDVEALDWLFGTCFQRADC